MKCFFGLLLFLLSYTAVAQTSFVPIRGRLIRIYTEGGSAELWLENATKGLTGGFLKNKAGGLTEFALAVDTVVKVGDSLRFYRAGSYFAIKAGADAVADTKVTGVAITGTGTKTVTVTNSDGTTAAGTFTDEGTTYSTTDNAISITGTTISTRKGTQTFTDGATITVNCSQGYTWKGTIAGNRTLAFSNAQDGDIITVYITQDATGSRTMTWPAGTVWINPSAPTLKTAGGSVDRVVFHYVAGTWYGSY